MYEKEIATIEEFKKIYREFIELGGQPVHDEDFWLGLTPPPPNPARLLELRQELNLRLSAVGHFLRACGTPTSVFHSPAPIRGGIAGNIDLFGNIFNLETYEIEPIIVFDALERGLGTYKFLLDQYRRKRWNPLWWVGQIIRLPFVLLRWAGFDGSKIEGSLMGKI